MSRTHFVFPIRAAFFANIYEPHRPDPMRTHAKAAMPSYGLSFIMADAPEELIPYLPPHTRNLGENGRPNEIYSRATSEKPPVVVVGDHAAAPLDATVFLCADDANIPRDKLFFMTPMEIAVSLIEFRAVPRDTGYEPSHAHRCGFKPILKAIRVRNDVITKRYDEECARWFTGA